MSGVWNSPGAKGARKILIPLGVVPKLASSTADDPSSLIHSNSLQSNTIVHMVLITSVDVKPTEAVAVFLFKKLSWTRGFHLLKMLKTLSMVQ